MLFLFYVLYLSIITCIINARRLHHLVLEYHKICLDLLLFRVLFQFFSGGVPPYPRKRSGSARPRKTPRCARLEIFSYFFFGELVTLNTLSFVTLSLHFTFPIFLKQNISNTSIFVSRAFERVHDSHP